MKGTIYIARTTSGRGSAVARAAWNTRTTDSLALDSILSVAAHRTTLPLPPHHPRPPCSLSCFGRLLFKRIFLLLFSPFLFSLPPQPYIPLPLLYSRELFTLPEYSRPFLVLSLSDWFYRHTDECSSVITTEKEIILINNSWLLHVLVFVTLNCYRSIGSRHDFVRLNVDNWPFLYEMCEM